MALILTYKIDILFVRYSILQIMSEILCKNEDCVAIQDDVFTEKCSICPGYYADDGLNDILFIEESPNNRRATCDLCKETKDIVQMKSTGQFICQNACDEDGEDSDDDYDEK